MLNNSLLLLFFCQERVVSHSWVKMVLDEHVADEFWARWLMQPWLTCSVHSFYRIHFVIVRSVIFMLSVRYVKHLFRTDFVAFCATLSLCQLLEPLHHQCLSDLLLPRIIVRTDCPHFFYFFFCSMPQGIRLLLLLLIFFQSVYFRAFPLSSPSFF